MPAGRRSALGTMVEEAVGTGLIPPVTTRELGNMSTEEHNWIIDQMRGEAMQQDPRYRVRVNPEDWSGVDGTCTVAEAPTQSRRQRRERTWIDLNCRCGKHVGYIEFEPNVSEYEIPACRECQDASREEGYTAGYDDGYAYGSDASEES